VPEGSRLVVEVVERKEEGNSTGKESPRITKREKRFSGRGRGKTSAATKNRIKKREKSLIFMGGGGKERFFHFHQERGRAGCPGVLQEKEMKKKEGEASFDKTHLGGKPGGGTLDRKKRRNQEGRDQAALVPAEERGRRSTS